MSKPKRSRTHPGHVRPNTIAAMPVSVGYVTAEFLEFVCG
jgi:hypothetical protein